VAPDQSYCETLDGGRSHRGSLLARPYQFPRGARDLGRARSPATAVLSYIATWNISPGRLSPVSSFSYFSPVYELRASISAVLSFDWDAISGSVARGCIGSSRSPSSKASRLTFVSARSARNTGNGHAGQRHHQGQRCPVVQDCRCGQINYCGRERRQRHLSARSHQLAQHHRTTRSGRSLAGTR
jgi:hypothetical protein